MQLPKNYFDNLSSTKYREYLKLLPNLEKSTTRNLTTLILTFAALSFFGIFAINPTLSTIVDLKKQLKDSQHVADQLQIKISNLSTLQQKYTALAPQMHVVYEGIPQTPSIFTLTGQIQALAQRSGISIATFRIFEVQLAGGKQLSTQEPSFGFSLEANGPYDKMLSFAASLTQLSRIITIESMSIKKNVKTDALVLEIRGRGYFKK